MRKASLHRPINHAVPVAVAMGAILARASAQPPCQYEVTVFTGPDTCGKYGDPPVPVTWAINNAGEIVGYYTGCKFPVQFAFVWDERTRLRTLSGLAGYGDARAYDLIDADYIVGTMRFGEQEHGVLWNQGVPIDIGIPPGGNSTAALAVNSKGQITGYWGNTVQGGWHVFLWDGTLTDLGGDFTTENDRGRDINELGQITGWMGQAPHVESHAFIWDDGKVIELPHIPGGYTNEGKAINDHGDVVGNGFLPYDNKWGWVRRAYYWSEGTAMNLGTLPGCQESFAHDINNDRTVVG